MRVTRRVAALASVVLAVPLSAAGCWFLGGDVVVRLSEAQVQTALDLRFPVAKTYLGQLSLAYHDPEVQLAEGSDRIGVGMSFTLSVGSEEDHRAYSGRAHLTAGIGYDADSALVLLEAPVLDSLSLGQLSIGYVEQANELARGLAQDRLSRIPVYNLKEEGFVLGAAALILEDVTVEDGRLIVTLGRPH